VFSQISPSDNYSINVKRFTMEDGLSHRVVTCFTKDGRGIKWIGTRNGLNRFDGQKFKVFGKSAGLLPQRIIYMYPDGDVIWLIYKKEEKISKFDNFQLFHTIKEKVITLEEHYKDRLPFKTEHVTYIDKVGMGTQTDGLPLIIEDDVHGKRFFIYTQEEGFKHLPGIDTGYIMGRMVNQHYLWRNSGAVPDIKDDTIVEINDAGKWINSLPLDKFPKDTKRLFFFPFKKTFEGYQICYYYYKTSKDIGVFCIDAETHQRKQIEFPLIGTNGVDGIIKMHDHPMLDAFWFTHSNRGKGSLVNAYGKTLFTVNYEEEAKAAGRTFLEENIIWQGSDNGFYQIEFKEKKFKTIFKDQKLSDFRSITRIDSSLVMTSYSGQFLVNPDLKPPFSKILNGISLNFIQSRNGNYWMDLHRKSLQEYNPTTKKYVSNTTIYDAHSEIWSIYEDKNGLIWSSFLGIRSLNPNTYEIKEGKYNEFTELKEHTVYHFYEKEDGNLLLCSTGGLYEMNLEQGIIARYWSGGKGKYHLPFDDVRHLYYDKTDKSYWFATNQAGIVHWKPQNNEVEAYELNQIDANIMHAVYPDFNSSFLWISTENGIVQFDKITKWSKSYLPKDGTSSHEFNRISHFQDTDGTIYFGSINGVTVFHPKDFREAMSELEDVKIIIVEYNQYLNATNRLENLTSQLLKNKRIKVASGDRFFTLKLALTDYSYNKKAIYSFKLKGEDEDWTVSSTNEFFISGLPFGRHIIEIRGLLSNGQFSSILEVPVFVQRPFYLRWWFIVLIIISAIGGGLFYTKIRTRQLNKQNEVLITEVAKRTQKIELQAKELQELDKTKSRFFANVSHELRTPITLIQGPIESVIKMRENSNKGITLLLKAEQNTGKLLSLVNEILELTKLDANKLILEEEPLVFYTFLRRIIGSFQSITDRKNIQFIFEYQLREELKILLDEKKVEIILNNLLSNAFKFTFKNGKILVQVLDKASQLQIMVKDNGRGIPEEDIPHIFNRFYQSSKNKKTEGGLGIGLSLSMEYIKIMNGKMWVESQVSGIHQGTTFFIEIPKKEVISMVSTSEKLAINQPLITTTTIPTIIEKVQSDIEFPQLLIVEDNYDLSDYLKSLLLPYYQIATAENGEEALNWLSNNKRPSLILSDVMMPIMDGFEFLEHVKNNEQLSGIPFVMLTARGELKDKLKALRIGVDDYLVKPFKEEELLVRIENLLANYEERVAYQQTEEPSNEENNEEQLAPKNSKADQLWLEQLETLIQKNITDSRFSVDYVAETIAMNRNSLYKKIKRLTGLTPNQYIRVVRLQMAKDFLENRTYNSIKEVAAEVGFQRSDYFAKLYKKEYGKAPIDYFN